MNENEEYYPSAAQQIAFSEAHALYLRLIKEHSLDSAEVGRGLLIAAISCLRQTLSNEEIAGICYEFADDFAVRVYIPKQET